MLLKIKVPTNIIVVGATCSGKTMWIYNLLKSSLSSFDKPIDRIIYCYNTWQDVYDTMERDIAGIEFHSGIPWDIVETLTPNSQTILVADDLMEELANDRRLTHMFTRWRHKRITPIFVMQNFYCPGKYVTTATRNAQYIVYFNQPRDLSVIRTLGQQIDPTRPRFLVDAYKKATSRKFGYLFIDLQPHTDQRYRVREGVLDGEKPYVYIPV